MFGMHPDGTEHAGAHGARAPGDPAPRPTPSPTSTTSIEVVQLGRRSARRSCAGYRIVSAPAALRHFTATFEPIPCTRQSVRLRRTQKMTRQSGDHLRLYVRVPCAPRRYEESPSTSRLTMAKLVKRRIARYLGPILAGRALNIRSRRWRQPATRSPCRQTCQFATRDVYFRVRVTAAGLRLRTS